MLLFTCRACVLWLWLSQCNVAVLQCLDIVGCIGYTVSNPQRCFYLHPTIQKRISKMKKNSTGVLIITDNFDPDGRASAKFVKYSDMPNDELVERMINGDSNAALEYMKRKKGK